MKKIILVLTLSALWLPTLSWAQLYPQNEAGVTLAAWHTTVRDVDASKKFWSLFGGIPMKIEGVDVVELRGVLVFLHPGEPDRGTLGDLIDHVAMNCQNCFYLVKRLVEAGYKTEPINPETMRGPNWKPTSVDRAWTYAYSPDGLRIEIETNPCTFRATYKFLLPPQLGLEPCPETIAEGPPTEDPAGAIGSDEVHFFMKSVTESKALNDFLTKYFGGRQVQYPNANASIPGAIFYTAIMGHEGAGYSNEGGALPSIGFEVKNLEAFTKKLQAAGVHFTEPYSKTRYKTYAHAAFTDAWGDEIQLTEGLNRFITKAPRVVSQEKQTVAAAGLPHGKQVFDLYCGYCHASATTKSQYGGAPGLKGLFSMPPHKLRDHATLEHTEPQIRQLIVEGNVKAGGAMRPIASYLSSAELDDLMAYLKTL